MEAIKRILQRKFQFLLASLVLLFVLMPFFRHELISDLVQSFVLLFGVYAVSSRRGSFVVSAILMFLTLAAVWLNYHLQMKPLFLLSHILYFAFCGLLSTVILTQVLRAQRVTSDVIAGAICVYLVLGVLWANVFAVIETVQPGSFAGLEVIISPDKKGVLEDQFSHFIYYSYVTMSTLGYGEIVPVTRPARSLAALEAIMGQLYLATLIARLVGMHISYRPGEDDP
jgi:hypothetical protein